MSRIPLTALAIVSLALAACGKDDPPKPAPPPPPKPKVEAAVTAAPPPAPGPQRRNLPDPPPLPPVAVDNVAVGKAIGPDRKIDPNAGPITSKDTIYASVDTSGAGEVTLKARWNSIAEGKATMLKEDSQPVVATGPMTHEFHFAAPGGWKPGDYQVEIFVNDRPAATRRFGVS